ncbi:MAG TPA: hypothetical protein VFT91_09145 [Dehalococcoidia bacterium]|nr:hypothetical protein [Dehalococcoidia bacterium]
MASTWRAASAGLDAATAACAALNLAYFAYRLAPGREATVSRRVALAALALISLAALVESLLSLAVVSSAPEGSLLASLPWAAGRALPLAGSGFMSLLVLRRLSSS